MFCRVFCLITLFFFAVDTYAYSKKNHENITREAATLAYSCSTSEESPELVKALVDFNVDQDQLLRKTDLWHFPPPLDGQTPPSKSTRWFVASLLVQNTDYSVWVRYLVDSIVENPQSAVAPAGALLHYLQDVVVPAHAIPVFHPVSLLPPKTDGFDDWDEFEGISFEPNICDEIAKPFNLSRLVSNERKKTLDLLKGANSESAPKWAEHWDTSIGDKGFGEYRCSSEAFGVEGGLDCLKDGTRFSQKDFERIATQRMKEAVISSAKLILHVIKQAPDCSNDRCSSYSIKRKYLPSTVLLKKLNAVYQK